MNLQTKRRKLVMFSVKKSVLFVFVGLFTFSCMDVSQAKYSTKELKSLINSYMSEQEQSWNEGDLEGFMKHYWRSDDLRFIGKGGLNAGWQNTLDNYYKSYPSKTEMGILKFTNKSIDIFGEQAIFVIGEWKLSRGENLEDLSGMYSLIWENKNGKWVITTDHSS